MTFNSGLYGLYYTDRICHRYLEGSHFLDLGKAQAHQMENLIRMMHVFGKLCQDLSEQMAPYAEAQG